MKSLARLRKAAGYTQMGFAAALGVTQSTVALWEAGSIWPSAEKLPSIARLLNCTIDDLYASASA